ncbi:MAG: phospholipase D family protein [Gammaproteobacteria bacterium]
MPTDYEQLPSYVVMNTNNTHLAKKIMPVAAKHPDKSGFYMLSSGMDAFIARVALIELAERSLDIQYYIWNQDTTGKLLVDRLLAAADRGVRVRLLLDDLDTRDKEHGLKLLDAHANIEIRLYNPFAHRGSRAVGFVSDLRRVNRRMHNKSMTADNQVTIVGGRNIGNEYFGATSHAEFSDLDALSIGPIVKDVSTMFDEYWNSQWVIPVKAFGKGKTITKDALLKARNEFKQTVNDAKADPYVEALQHSEILKQLEQRTMKFYWGKAVLIYDAPSKVDATEINGDTHLAPKLSSYINKANKEIIIVSPYFVPGKRLVETLGQTVERGIRVRILTNSLAANDVGVVHAGYMRYRVDLLKRGVELYEFKNTLAPVKGRNKKWTGSSYASLHAKTFGLDRKAMFVGSFNLDPRSIALNTEMGVLFENYELAETMAKKFDDIVTNNAYRLKLITTPADEAGVDFDEHRLQWIGRSDGKTVRYNVEPDTSLWQRFVAGFWSVFVIESFL